MIPKEDERSRQRLRHCTMLDAGADHPLRLIVGSSHYDLDELQGDRQMFLKLKSMFDGRHSVTEMATKTGLSETDIHGVVEAFDEWGLLRQETPVEMVPVDQFRALIKPTLLMWRNQIGFHRLFQDLSAGRASRNTLTGLFIETYHVVRLASVHIAAAISATDSDRTRHALSQYLSEEYDHAHFLKDTCVNLGCRPRDVEDAHPIVGTLSLIHMLCDIGRTDPLAYAAALALFEAGPSDGTEGHDSIRLIAAAYDLDELVFAPALAHLQCDLDAEHNSMLDLFLEGQEALPAERVHAICNMLHDLKHAYDQMHDGILTYYEDVSNYVPRVKVDFFSL